MHSTFLPPATKLGQVYVFTHVCDSVHGGRCPGPHLGGRLRRLAGGRVSRPTSREEVEGSGGGDLQAHTQGGIQAHTGGGSPGPHPGRVGLQATPGGEVSRPTPGGGSVSFHARINPPPMATAAGGTHPTGMHSCRDSFSLS